VSAVKPSQPRHGQRWLNEWLETKLIQAFPDPVLHVMSLLANRYDGGAVTVDLHEWMRSTGLPARRVRAAINELLNWYMITYIERGDLPRGQRVDTARTDCRVRLVMPAERAELMRAARAAKKQRRIERMARR